MNIEQSTFLDDMYFLKDLAKAVVETSRVQPGQYVAGRGPNITGNTLIRPGGSDSYFAFWIRDFAMSLESGLISQDELEHALILTACCQANQDWQTATGSFVPRGSIADHITFDAKPIFFPGTDDFDAQGQPWGYYPSLDNHFYFMEMAWQLAVVYGQETILKEKIKGMNLLNRLDLAFSVPQAEVGSELVRCDEQKRGVSFGFTDIVVHTGLLLFCSILRYRAAKYLADLHQLCNDQEAAAKYRTLAATISEKLPRTFADESGLLLASTGKSAQPDVWGSAFAIYSGALSEDEAEKVSYALTRCLSDNSIAWKGNIRHVPIDRDFSETSAWEEIVDNHAGKNRYQNGAYWNTPTGWVCHAVSRVDADAARKLAVQYIEELRSNDFRKGEEYGSPYECMHPDGDYRKNPIYMTSVTCPLAAFQTLGWLPESENAGQIAESE